MDTSIKHLNKWANAHTYYSLDILRIALGVFLIMKGYSFVTQHREFADIIAPISNFLGGMFTLHYVAFAHMLGGFLITFGLLTRWCLIAQIPILIGAVAVNFFGIMNVENLILSFITLCISIFFIIYGSGKHSADYFFKMEK